MTTDQQDQESSGAAFRQKFEALQARANALSESYAGTFKYVKAADLVDVDPSQLASKAQEIETARKAEREASAREFLIERGVAEDQLEAVLSGKPAAVSPTVVEDGAQARIASLGQLPGTPIQQNNPYEGVFGEDRIRAAIAASSGD